MPIVRYLGHQDEVAQQPVEIADDTELSWWATSGIAGVARRTLQVAAAAQLAVAALPHIDDEVVQAAPTLAEDDSPWSALGLADVARRHAAGAAAEQIGISLRPFLDRDDYTTPLVAYDITAVYLTAGSGVNITQVDTADFTVRPGRLYLFIVDAHQSAGLGDLEDSPASPEGAISWWPQSPGPYREADYDTPGTPTRRLYVWSGSPTFDNLVHCRVSWFDVQTSVRWAVVEVTGVAVDASAPDGNTSALAIVQHASNSQGLHFRHNVHLAPFESVKNAVIAAFGIANVIPQTPSAVPPMLDTVDVNSDGGDLFIEFFAGAHTGPGIVFSDNIPEGIGGVALELRAGLADDGDPGWRPPLPQIAVVRLFAPTDEDLPVAAAPSFVEEETGAPVPARLAGARPTSWPTDEEVQVGPFEEETWTPRPPVAPPAAPRVLTEDDAIERLDVEEDSWAPRPTLPPVQPVRQAVDDEALPVTPAILVEDDGFRPPPAAPPRTPAQPPAFDDETVQAAAAVFFDEDLPPMRRAPAQSDRIRAPDVDEDFVAAAPGVLVDDAAGEGLARLQVIRAIRNLLPSFFDGEQLLVVAVPPPEPTPPFILANFTAWTLTVPEGQAVTLEQTETTAPDLGVSGLGATDLGTPELGDPDLGEADLDNPDLIR